MTGPAEVGLVGLGAMGSRIARRLTDAGHRLALFDVREEAMVPFAGTGAELCESPAAVADRATVVLASLPTPGVVSDAVRGDRGLIGGDRMSTFVDLSTTGFAVARELAEALGDAGVDYLDAPVSGGVRGAEAGTLAIFAAGDPEVFERVLPLLETFGETPLRVGSEPGQGQVAKLLNNLLSAAAMAITSEAMSVGVRAGLEPRALLDAFNAGSGRNTATSLKFPEYVLNRRFDSGFRLRLMLKDVRLCLAQARDQRSPMFLGGVVEQLWSLAAANTDEESDHTEIARVFEEWAGVTIADQAEIAHA